MILSLALNSWAQNVTTASAELSWKAPTTNEDGTPLTDLVGYRVKWGDVQDTWAQTTDVDQSITSHTIPALARGKVWYFGVSALDMSGNESATTSLGKAFFQVTIDVTVPSAPLPPDTGPPCAVAYILSTGATVTITCDPMP